MNFIPEITLGNVLTLGTAVVGIILAFARIAAQTQKNKDDLSVHASSTKEAIETLRRDREKAAGEIYAELRREDADVRRELRTEKDVLHHRLDRHDKELTDAINGLTIETRAMHKENMASRERVASEYVTHPRLADAMEAIHRDFETMGERLDRFVTALAGERKPGV